MTDPQQTAIAGQQTVTAAQPLRIPTGQELYDMLMGHIEPELTTQGIKDLDEKYKNETPQENAIRKQRYQLAVDRYQQAYEGYMQTLDAQVQRYKRATFGQVEIEDREREEGTLQNLLQAFA
ncbi:hypothetical protein HY213_05235 [Candidatus Peregrinibacteria bacterium]|nr:hypothetical protein [Candidatus Peregrinibacteria bacterium]